MQFTTNAHMHINNPDRFESTSYIPYRVSIRETGCKTRYTTRPGYPSPIKDGLSYVLTWYTDYFAGSYPSWMPHTHPCAGLWTIGPQAPGRYLWLAAKTCIRPCSQPQNIQDLKIKISPRRRQNGPKGPPGNFNWIWTRESNIHKNYVQNSQWHKIYVFHVKPSFYVCLKASRKVKTKNMQFFKNSQTAGPKVHNQIQMT